MPTFMRRKVLFLGLALTANAALAQTPARRDTTRDLRNVFAPGYILQDRNGDDVIDFVNAKVVLPSAASQADLAAAANIAARLGYETSATNLDLTMLDTSRAASFATPIVIVGANNALLT